MANPFNPVKHFGCDCAPPVPQPLPLPQDKYPLEGSDATVTSDGVFKALQDLTQAYGEVLGNLGDLQTSAKTNVVGAINEVFLNTLNVDGRTQHIAQILAAPLAIGPTYLWLGSDCSNGTHSVQVIVNATSNPQLITGAFNGVFTQYVLPDWDEVLVRIDGMESLKFYIDPRLGGLDRAYILPLGGIPLSDLSASVQQSLVPSGGTAGQVLMKSGEGAAGWQALPSFLLAAVSANTSSINLTGTGTTLNPLRATVNRSAQDGNVLQRLADGLYVPAASANVATEVSQTVAFVGNGTAATPLRANVTVANTADNQLKSTIQGLYVPPAAEDGHVMYDEAQALSAAQQTQARSNIGAASYTALQSVRDQVSAAQASADAAEEQAVTAGQNASAAQTAATAAQTAATAAASSASAAQTSADSAITELSNKVSRRSSGNEVYAHTGATDVGITVAHAYTSNAIPRYNAQGTLTGATPTQVDEYAPKQYVDDRVAAAGSGLYIGGFFFGKTTSSFVVPNPTAANENYFDFPTLTVYKAKTDLSGWDVDKTIAAPINGATIDITSEFWDLSLDSGLPGTARWSDDTSDWVYRPSRFESAPDAQTIIINASGELSVGVSADPANIIQVKPDGLFAEVQEFNLPDAPTTQSSNVLVVDSTGSASWSTAPLTALNTAVSTAQSTANTAYGNANAAQSTANTALLNASTAQADAITAQDTAEQAGGAAAIAKGVADSAVAGLVGKVDKATTTTGMLAYTVTFVGQGTTSVVDAASASTIAYRSPTGTLKAADPAVNSDLVTLSYLTTQLGTVTTNISAVSATANDAASDAQIALTAAQDAETIASNAALAVNGKVDKKTTAGLFVYSHSGTSEGEIATSTTPVAGTVVVRGTNGVVQGADPAVSADLVSLGYLNTQTAAINTSIGNKVDKIATTGLAAYTKNGSVQGSVSIVPGAAIASTLVQRDTAGAIFTAMPTNAAHAATKAYVDALAGSGQPLEAPMDQVAAVADANPGKWVRGIIEVPA